ncbi:MULTISPECIES: hypothetical protein [unclassified Pseudoalteromonas]|uniref:hypothetical protein n=1 Tax=unclassified Pseudoalteromonas TaxID=194690 RepID=UPI0015728AD0|nr:hypothetical protein [Pseudoalteromonas sp. JC28]
MKTLIYVVGLALFSFFTDFSSSSGFEGIFSPILSGLLLILLVGKVTSSFGGSGNYTGKTNGDGGGFFGNSGGDGGCNGGDGGSC